MKYFLALFITALIFNSASAAEIVYPKADLVSTDADTIFFVGSENPDAELKINSETVDVHKSGGFYHPVHLGIGDNTFSIENNLGEKKVYTVRRIEKADNCPNIIEEKYKHPAIYMTLTNDVPLRSTPYNYGINRLQHLQKGIPLKVIGEYQDYYKVQLARDDYAWIDKKHVEKSDVRYDLVKVQSFEYKEAPESRIFVLKLNKKAPYILSEAGGLDLVVYNLEGYPENKYEFHINNTEKLFGYKSYYTVNNELVIEVKNPLQIDKSQPLKGLNITLDPGHGGDEWGAVGCLGDREKDVNLEMVKYLKSTLEEAGANVFLTRDEDVFLGLGKRVDISRANNSDVFISIHNNALPNSAAFSERSGVSVYYFMPQSKPVASVIQANMVENLGLNNDKVRRESFYVLRNTESLAILIEVGYMIMPDDNAKIINPEFQKETAQVIKQGLEKYYNGL